MDKKFSTLPPAHQLTAIMTRIYNLRLTTPSGGNISVIDDEGNIWATPSQIDKGTLTPDDMVKITPDGKMEGKHKPTMEYRFHKGVYEVRPDVKAVTHAHPAGLVAFSMIENRPGFNNLPALTDQVVPVGFAPYAIPGSAALGERIKDAFREGYAAIYMENHGIITCGGTLPEAFYRMENLETVANIYIQAHRLGTVLSLTPDELQSARDHAAKSFPEMDSKPPFENEQAVRAQMCSIISRSYERRLITASAGCFSARVGHDAFVIMPEGGDPAWLTTDDLVLVSGGTVEKGKRASRYADLHRAIYQHHPGIDSVACAHPVALMAFAITAEVFDSRTIPESFLFLNVIPRIDFSTRYTSPESVAQVFDHRVQSALISNECFVVTGNSLFQVFDRLEVAEFTARSIIDARPIGRIKPISDADIEELVRVFMA